MKDVLIILGGGTLGGSIAAVICYIVLRISRRQAKAAAMPQIYIHECPYKPCTFQAWSVSQKDYMDSLIDEHEVEYHPFPTRES